METQQETRLAGRAAWPPWQRGGGFSAEALKIIAIVAMVIDHGATALVADYYSNAGVVLHFIGRITGPTMFFFIAEGYRHSSNHNRYTLRLGLFALVSYLPFIFFKTGALPDAESWNSFNVIYTLFLGHLMLRARHEVKNVWLQWGAIILLILLSYYGDWGYTGTVCILLFDIFAGDFRLQRLAYCLFVLLVKLLPPALDAMQIANSGGNPSGLVRYIIVLSGMFLPIILLGFYNGGRGRGSKWLFYIFYPAHLVVLGVVRLLLPNVL